MAHARDREDGGFHCELSCLSRGISENSEFFFLSSRQGLLMFDL